MPEIEKKQSIDKLISNAGSWNYRLIRKLYIHKDNPNFNSEYFEFHAVSYDDMGRIISWTETPMNIVEETVEDIKFTLDALQEALKKPTLEIVTIDGAEQLQEFNSDLQ